MKKLDSQSKGQAPARKIRFQGWLLDELNRLAESDRRSFSEYCRLVLERHVEERKR